MISLAGGTHSRKLSGFRILDLSFVDARDGYALGRFFGTDAQPVDPPVMAMLRTSDGGERWITVGAPPEPVEHITFGTRRLGWAFGPKLFVTRDGGGSWFEDHLGGRMEAVAADRRSVWVVSGRCRAVRCGFRIHASSDGGHSWQTASRWGRLDDPCDHDLRVSGGARARPVFESPLAPIDHERPWLLCADEPSLGTSDVVQFVDAMRGWAASGRSVYRTTDGGRHWVGVRLHPSACGCIHRVDGR